MKKIHFSDIFSNDYLTLVTTYRALISDVLDKYDVAIFMARKAICFYTAMKSNGEIENKKCHVISSRVIDYDSLERFRGKQIAVIDDVVVKGDSMNEMAYKLTQAKIQADYYVAACEKNFPERLTSKEVVLEPSYSHYAEDSIYQLAGLITQYIEASMCSFNIDSPIYDVYDNNEKIRTILEMVGAPDLTSGNQRKNKIESRIIYFSVQKNQYTEKFLNILDRAIIKIRFYIRERRVIAVPFVLLPGDNSVSIDKFYTLIKSPMVDRLIDCGNARVCDENKLKIVSYLLSMSLVRQFAKQYDIRMKRHLENDMIQFDQNVDDILCQKQKTDLDNIFSNICTINVNFSPFIFSEYIRGFYLYILHFNSEQQLYQNRSGEMIGSKSSEDYLNKLVFSYEDLYAAVGKTKESVIGKKVYISSVIDVFIDRGFIVPSIVHYPNGNSVRVYKMGEYSKLTRDQINAFAKMLFIYQGNIGRELDKTEFEKLCVLFFRAEINNHMFVEGTTFEEGVYGIGYSLYGPRVSNGGLVYAVSSTSAIVTDFYENGLVKIQNGKYYIDHDVTVGNFDMGIDCSTFASDFSELAKVFDENTNNKDKIISNQYVHTYNQFLTLSAINLSPKNQILSLCAEIYQFLKLKEDIFFKPLESIPLGTYRRVVSAINSGLWKYRCFKNDAYIKTTMQIKKNCGDNAIRGIPRVKVIADENNVLIDMLEQCGKLLYQIAFLLNEVLCVKDRNRALKPRSVPNEDISGLKNVCLFTKADYFYKEFKSDRQSMKAYVDKYKDSETFNKNINICFDMMKRRARKILDWCDLYLEKNNAEYRLIQQFLVVVSREYDLPLCLFERNNMNLKHITDLERIVVIPMINEAELDPILHNLLHTTSEVNDVNFLLFDISNTDYSLVQIGNCAKGSCMENSIKKVISMIMREPVSEFRKFYYVSLHNKEMQDLEHFEVDRYENIIFKNKYYIKKYILRRKEKMNQVTNNISIGNYIKENVDSVVINDSEIGGDVIGMNSKEDNINNVFNEIREASMGLSDVQKDEMEEYIEAIQDVTQHDNPKKGMLKTAFKGLKEICTNPKYIEAVSKLAPIIQKIVQ